MVKRLCSSLVAAVVVALLIVAPVLAAYYVDIDVTESNGTDYVMLPIITGFPTDFLVDQHFIFEDGTDIRIEDSEGNNVPFMPADDKLVFASNIIGSMVNTFHLTTNNTPLSSFPVCVGNGGYVSITDNATLEPGNEFEIEFEGWVSTGLYYPIVEATETSYEDTQQASHTVGLTDGIENGDLLLMLFDCVDPEAGFVGGTIGWPSGWTEMEWYWESDAIFGVAYKVATGSEGATVTVTTPQSGYSAHQTFRIVDYQGTPEISTEQFGAGAWPTSPSLSPTWGSTMGTLWISTFGSRMVKSVNLTDYPLFYSAGQFTEANGSCIGAATRELIATSEDPSYFTLDDGLPVVAYTVGIEGAQGETTELISKEQAFRVYTTGGGNITAEILTVENPTSLYLYPDGVGNYTEITGQTPGSGEHWDKVDDPQGTPDDNTTYITENSTTEKKDMYALSYNSTLDDKTITNVTVYSRFCGALNTSGEKFLCGDAHVTYYLRSGNVESNGTTLACIAGASYATFSESVERPGGGCWLFSDLEDLEVGVGMYVDLYDEYPACSFNLTQLYVEVTYGDLGVAKAVTASGIDAGEHTINVWADGTDFGIDVDGVTEDTVALGLNATATSLYLYPDGVGNYTNITTQYPISTFHWDKVDDPSGTPDDDSTCIIENSVTEKKDMYTLSYNSTLGGKTIESVTVHFRFRGASLLDGGDSTVIPYLRLGGSEVAGDPPASRPAGAGYISLYREVSRPGGGSWVPDDIETLQVGIGMSNDAGSSFNLTQVYAEVTYMEKASVPDTASDWSITMPYFEYYQYGGYEGVSGVLYENCDTSPAWAGQTDSAGIQLLAQTFTPTTSHDIESASIYADRYGSSFTANYTLAVRATSGGKPTGSDLCSVVFDPSTMGVMGVKDWQAFNFSTSYSVSAGTKYALVLYDLDNNDPLVKGVEWAYDAPSSTYTGGDMVKSSNNGTSWIAYSGYDFLFREYGSSSNFTPILTYEPTSIIEGTTLPNEESPGTYDGIITWGSNPDGITVDLSTLESDETYYYYSETDATTPDVLEPEPAAMTGDVALDKLEDTPLTPLVEGLVEGSNGQLTARLVWLGIGWFVFIGVLVFVFLKTKENIVLTTAAGLGLSAILYSIGIFIYPVVILLGIGFIAAIVHERMPQL